MFFRQDQSGAAEYIPSRYKVPYGGRGSAKCLAFGTKVIMADGSLRAIETIAVGERVLGPDSLPRTVLDVARGTAPMYRVRQSSGVEYVVNDAHILSVKKSRSATTDFRIQKNGVPRSPNGRYASWPEVTHISAAAFAVQSKRWQAHFRGYRAGVLQFPAQQVRIDPYFLGVWLGDGTSRELRITTADSEIVEYCRNLAVGAGGNISVRKISDDNAASDVGVCVRSGRLNLLWEPFKSYGLPNNKHIPHEFIANSESVRLQVLAGLIDTDGSLNGGCYAIAQVNERLARDIKYVADTLGFRTSIKKRATVCTNNGVRGSAWYVSISGGVSRIPCRIARKRVTSEQLRPNKDHLLSQLTVTPIGPSEYAGFTLSGDHLFLLEDGTVTHNTWGVAGLSVALGSIHQMRFLCVREYQSSIRDSVHQILSSRIIDLGLSRHYDVQRETIIGKQRTKDADGYRRTEFIFAGVKTDPSKVKGTEDVDVCFIEEGEKISKESWKDLHATVRNRRGGSEIWCVFNPRDQTDPTYQRLIAREPCPPHIRRQKLNFTDNPWFPRDLAIEREDLLDQIRDTKDEDERVQLQQDYEHIWLGECQKRSDAAIFRRRVVVEAFPDPPEKSETVFRYGADWGFANDPTALVRMWVTVNADKSEDLWISHEAFGYRVENDEIPALFDAVPGVRKWPIKADSARPETISHVKKFGFRISAAEKWSGSLEDGIAHVKAYRRIHIHSRCKHLQEEARLYSYKIDRVTAEVLPIVVDKWNHGWDAVRYGLDGLIQHKRSFFG